MNAPAPLTREQLASLATRHRRNPDARLLLGEIKRLRDLVLSINQQHCKLARYTDNPGDALVLATIIELTENEPVVIERTPRHLHQQPQGRRWPHLPEGAEAKIIAIEPNHTD